MNGPGKSDRLILPAKSPNKTAEVTEVMEGSGLAKSNAGQQNTRRTQSRGSVSNALERIRSIAKRDRKKQFTSLFHHVYNIDTLRQAFFALKRDASAGVDGETWRQYAEDLEAKLQDLSARLQRGSYRAQPVRRVNIPKPDGKLRPLGVPTLEDKIVQRATVAVLNNIYEVDFAGFSYGFRPKRGQHQALEAARVALMGKVNWVLDADIRGFFDAIDHEWLTKFVKHRLKDARLVRLIQKWLAAGVMEDGKWRRNEAGTPQGGSISPLLANLYLHYAFDLWVQWWRKQSGRGNVIVVRFADDFVMGFQHKDDAEQFLRDLRQRFAKFELELHPEKTRLIRFGRYATATRTKHGKGRPETFNFLGFTHICGRTREGEFSIKRQTERKRMIAKLKALRLELRQRMHHRVPEVGRWLAMVLRGHYNYYGLPTNSRALSCFRWEVARAWYKTLRRRSQRCTLTWKRMYRLITKWLPPARLVNSHQLVQSDLRQLATV